MILWSKLWRSGLLGRFILLCMGVWLHAVDSLVTATILPKVVSDIGGLEYVSWNFTICEGGSIVAGAACAMLCGRKGIRYVAIWGAALYGSGCVIAACATSMPWLLVGRLSQGVGGGLLVTLSYVAIEQYFPADLWTKLFGIVSVIWGGGSLLGPLIGGVLADAGMWRAVFVCFAAQATILGMAISRWLPRDQPKTAEDGRFPHMQIMGLLIATVMIGGAGVAHGLVTPIAFCSGGFSLLYLSARIDATSRTRLLPKETLNITQPLGAGYLWSSLCLPGRQDLRHTARFS